MKTILKRLLIPTLTKPPFANIGEWLLGNGVPIFMVHRMQVDRGSPTGISPEHLRRCLQYLVDKGFNFISLETIVQAVTLGQALPDKSVAFTMDDGFWDQAEIAAPIFIEFNCPVTFFVITGMLDNDLWPWDAKVAYLTNTTQKEMIEISLADEQFLLPVTNEPEQQKARNVLRDTIKSIAANDIESSLEKLEKATNVVIPKIAPPYLKSTTWETARQLEKHDIKFAPHTVSHRILSKLDATSAEKEIRDSWQRMKDELTSPSPIFGYPNGRYCDYGPREIALLKKYGFEGAVSTLPDNINNNGGSGDYTYNLPRYSLPTDFHEFMKYCSWIENMTHHNTL